MTRKELTNRCREIRDNNKWKTLNEDDFNFLMTEISPHFSQSMPLNTPATSSLFFYDVPRTRNISHVADNSP